MTLTRRGAGIAGARGTDPNPHPKASLELVKRIGALRMQPPSAAAAEEGGGAEDAAGEGNATGGGGEGTATGGGGGDPEQGRANAAALKWYGAKYAQVRDTLTAV